MRSMRGAKAWVSILLASAAAGCAPGVPTPPANAERELAANGLAASLQVESGTDSVRFQLWVTNVSSEAIELTFPTGQSFELVVEQRGREVWRWSEGMMFTQAIRLETLAAEETRTYSAAWSVPDELRGEVTVRGWLTAQEHRVEQRTTFRVP